MILCDNCESKPVETEGETMNLYEEAVYLADRLSLAEKAKLMEHLSSTLKHDLEIEAFRRMPWHEFIDRTAGSLANDPIARPEQLPTKNRESLE
jgi:hypothetical protein